MNATPVNAHLRSVAADLDPGRALDLGCGAGQDSVWLGQRGWDVTGVDSAARAITLADAAADKAGVGVSFEVADITQWTPGETYDLVVSTYALPPKGRGRTHALAMAANAVASGGTLLVTEFEISGSGIGWLAERDLVSLDEVLGHLSGWEIARADVAVADHSHGDRTQTIAVAVVVAHR